MIRSEPRVLLGAEALIVARGRRVLLRNLRLEVAAGDILQVAGPNGCGKSSLLRALAGVVEPRGGRIRRAVPCAFVPERVALPAGLKAASWLRLAGAGEARIAPELDCRCGRLSKGQLQRVALSAALTAAAGGPAVLVLDEPSTGLDSDAGIALAEQLAEVARNGSAVIFTDHADATVAPTKTLRLA